MSDIYVYLGFGLLMFVFACVRYLTMTGAYYLVVCKFFDKYLYKFKINKTRSTPKMIGLEMKWALINKINFAIIGIFTFWLYEMGYLKIYFDWNEYGMIYGLLTIPALLLIHDAYFFWLHWAMHYTRFKRPSRHHVHHQVANVSAWSAFSVHPVEGFLEVILRPIVLMILPLHPYSIAAFAVISFALNIIGHSGYEFFPKNFATSIFTKGNSSATFHYLHHQNPTKNLSLFFNYWDRIMGTLHPDYAKFYEETRGQVDAEKAKPLVAATSEA